MWILVWYEKLVRSARVLRVSFSSLSWVLRSWAPPAAAAAGSWARERVTRGRSRCKGRTARASLSRVAFKLAAFEADKFARVSRSINSSRLCIPTGSTLRTTVVVVVFVVERSLPRLFAVTTFLLSHSRLYGIRAFCSTCTRSFFHHSIVYFIFKPGLAMTLREQTRQRFDPRTSPHPARLSFALSHSTIVICRTYRHTWEKFSDAQRQITNVARNVDMVEEIAKILALYFIDALKFFKKIKGIEWRRNRCFPFYLCVLRLTVKKPGRVLTKAVCKNIFSTIESHALRLSFIYKIQIWNIITSIIKKRMWIGIPILLPHRFHKVLSLRKLLNLGFLTEEALWIHRIFILWRHDKKN